MTQDQLDDNTPEAPVDGDDSTSSKRPSSAAAPGSYLDEELEGHQEGVDLDALDNTPVDPLPDAVAAKEDGSDDDAPASDAPKAHLLQRFLQSTSKEKLAFGFVMSVAFALVIPFLGSVGFYDPWESHYAEVARQMAQRDDYLYPFWKNAYFFSKPILLFWTTALGYKVIGAGDATGELHWLAEWVGRLPMAMFSLMTTGAAFFALRRLWSLRAAVFGCLALSTTPFWYLISRQAITDMLYVGPMSIALLLLAVAFLDDERKELYETMPIPKWMSAFFALCLIPQLVEIARSGAFFNRLPNETAIRYAAMAFAVVVGGGIVFFLHKKAKDPLVHLAAAFVALGTLGKGPHTLAFTGLVLFLYFLTSGEWSRLKRPALLTGIFLYLMISLPWFITMYFFEGKNGRSKTWFQRFVLYDLFGRLGAGAHGDRGTFEYYVRYLGFGTFPWGTLVPFAVVKALTQGIGDKVMGKPDSRTASSRFTHFVALWAVALFVFFGFTTTKFHHYIFPVVVPCALLVGWYLDRILVEKKGLTGGVVVAVSLGAMLIARDLAKEPWQIADLFTYHYKSYKPDYYFPDVTPWRVFFLSVGGVAALMLLVGAISDALHGRNDRRFMPVRKLSSWTQGLLGAERGTGAVFAFLLAGFFAAMAGVYGYLLPMSQNWSQRWLVGTYYKMKKPGEPLISYQMDWKGETFYAHNTDVQIRKKGAKLKKECQKPGREFILVQTDRFKNIKKALGKEFEGKIRQVDKSNKKWVLVLIDE